MAGQLTESERTPVGILLAGIDPIQVPDVAREAEALGFESVRAPEDYLAGDPDRCIALILGRLNAGADTVVVCPMGPDPVEQIRRTAELVLPAVRAEQRAGGGSVAG